MSYCVNCGVELDNSEKKCPLCLTQVINPREINAVSEGIRPYPKRVETIMKHIDRRYGAVIASIILLIPLFIVAVIDLAVNHALTWSLYVAGALMILFVAVLLPLTFKNPKPLLFIGLNTLSVLLYTFLIDMTDKNTSWFLPISVPLCITLCALAVILTVLIRHRVFAGLYLYSAIFFAIGIYSVCVEIIINLWINPEIILYWSVFVLISCVILGVVLIVMEKQHKLKEAIARRLFV